MRALTIFLAWSCPWRIHILIFTNCTLYNCTYTKLIWIALVWSFQQFWKYQLHSLEKMPNFLHLNFGTYTAASKLLFLEWISFRSADIIIMIFSLRLQQYFHCRNVRASNRKMLLQAEIRGGPMRQMCSWVSPISGLRTYAFNKSFSRCINPK